MALFPPKNAPRRELRRIDLAVRGVVFLVVVTLTLSVAYLRSSGVLGGDPTVSAVLANAGGSLRKGSDVKVDGVIVGRVRSIGRAADGGVQVELAIVDSTLAQVPSNVVARILPASVFGTSYVDLVAHGGASSESLRAGAVIPQDRTQGTLELQQALDDIDRLVTALGPAELASAIGAAATALDGRGARLGDLLDDADRYLTRLEPLVPVARADIASLARSLGVVDDVLPDLLSATDDALVTLRTIVAQEASIAAILGGGTTLAQHAADLLDEQGRPLARFLDYGAVLLDAIYDNRRQGITGAITTNLALGAKIPGAIREGFVKTDGDVNLQDPGYYTRQDRPDFGSSSSRARASALYGTQGGAR